MRTVLRLGIGLLKISFLGLVVLWTMVMNFIGFMICAITSQG